MKYTMFFLAALVFLSGCSEEREIKYPSSRMICPESVKQERIDFVLQCIKDANPKSDEEPEDWIRQCEHTSKELFCPYVEVVVRKHCDGGVSDYCRELTVEPVES